MKISPTLDALYLEWAQYTGARTAREVRSENRARAIAGLLQTPTPENIEEARELAKAIYKDCL